MKTRLLISLFIFFSFHSLSAGPLSQKVSTNVLQDIDLETKIGQLLMVGVNGREMNALNEQKLRELKPGGVIFFGRNIKSAKQVSTFTHSLQESAASLGLPPLFIAVDQEGGSVTRLKHWPPIPSAAAVGQANSPDLAYKISLFSGQILKTLGFNMNLAPVLDLAPLNRKTFIGSRSYGSNPQHVGTIGSYSISGFSAAGVLPVAKHFPGHGQSVGDSHKNLPVSSKTLPELLENDLLPFKTVFDSGPLLGVMVAHISIPSIEPSGVASTYSNTLLSGVLREQLGFSGLVLTDDIEMLGAKGVNDPAERSVRALEAGADMIMVAWNPNSQARAKNGILKAIQAGRLSIERIDASVKRILEAKQKYNLEEKSLPPSFRQLELMVHHRELQRAIDQVAIQNLRLTRLSTNLSDLRLVISEQSAVTKLFKKQSKIQTRKFDLDQLSIDILKLSRKERALVHVQTTGEYEKLLTLDSLIKRKIILLATDLPFRYSRRSEFAGFISSMSPHPKIAEIIYEAFSASESSRLPASQNEVPNGRKDHK